MTQTTEKTLKYSKVDYCPSCNRKLCKRIEINHQPCVEFRHKGAMVTGQDLAIQCVGCKKTYFINAQQGIYDEA